MPTAASLKLMLKLCAASLRQINKQLEELLPDVKQSNATEKFPTLIRYYSLLKKTPPIVWNQVSQVHLEKLWRLEGVLYKLISEQTVAATKPSSLTREQLMPPIKALEEELNLIFHLQTALAEEPFPISTTDNRNEKTTSKKELNEWIMSLQEATKDSKNNNAKKTPVKQLYKSQKVKAEPNKQAASDQARLSESKNWKDKSQHLTSPAKKLATYLTDDPTITALLKTKLPLNAKVQAIKTTDVKADAKPTEAKASQHPIADALLIASLCKVKAFFGPDTIKKSDKRGWMHKQLDRFWWKEITRTSLGAKLTNLHAALKSIIEFIKKLRTQEEAFEKSLQKILSLDSKAGNEKIRSSPKRSPSLKPTAPSPHTNTANNVKIHTVSKDTSVRETSTNCNNSKNNNNQNNNDRNDDNNKKKEPPKETVLYTRTAIAKYDSKNKTTTTLAQNHSLFWDQQGSNGQKKNPPAEEVLYITSTSTTTITNSRFVTYLPDNETHFSTGFVETVAKPVLSSPLRTATSIQTHTKRTHDSKTNLNLTTNFDISRSLTNNNDGKRKTNESKQEIKYYHLLPLADLTKCAAFKEKTTGGRYPLMSRAQGANIKKITDIKLQLDPALQQEIKGQALSDLNDPQKGLELISRSGYMFKLEHKGAGKIKNPQVSISEKLLDFADKKDASKSNSQSKPGQKQISPQQRKWILGFDMLMVFLFHQQPIDFNNKISVNLCGKQQDAMLGAMAALKLLAGENLYTVFDITIRNSLNPQAVTYNDKSGEALVPDSLLRPAVNYLNPHARDSFGIDKDAFGALKKKFERSLGSKISRGLQAPASISPHGTHFKKPRAQLSVNTHTHARTHTRISTSTA